METSCCVVGGGPAGVMLSLGLRDLPPRVMAFGVRRVRLERTEELPALQEG